MIYHLRRHAGATNVVGFLIGKYGRGAALTFTAAILIRLYNEAWSNTAVVGGYHGPAGSPEFIGAALLFTAATLFYSIWSRRGETEKLSPIFSHSRATNRSRPTIVRRIKGRRVSTVELALAAL